MLAQEQAGAVSSSCRWKIKAELQEGGDGVGVKVMAAIHLGGKCRKKS